MVLARAYTALQHINAEMYQAFSLIHEPGELSRTTGLALLAAARR